MKIHLEGYNDNIFANTGLEWSHYNAGSRELAKSSQ